MNIIPMVTVNLPNGKVARKPVLFLRSAWKWERIDWDNGEDGKGGLWTRFTDFILRWPFYLHLTITGTKYALGDRLPPHKDGWNQEDQTWFAFVINKQSPKSGGELRSERFVINNKWFKIFEPNKSLHEVTEVTEGTREALIIIIRWGPRKTRHSAG